MSDKNYNWCGLSIKHEGGMEALHIGKLPGRKRICMYTIRSGTLEPLAYFESEAKAYDALRLIGILANVRLP